MATRSPRFGVRETSFVGKNAFQAIASEGRPVLCNDQAVKCLSAFVDELLFLQLGASSTSSTTSVPADREAAVITRARIGVPLTANVFKLYGLLRLLPNNLGRDAALEGELTLRDINKLGSKKLKADPALTKREVDCSEQDFLAVYDELRVWICELSQLSDAHWGNRYSLTKTMYDDSACDAVAAKVQAQMSTHKLYITPILAFYTTVVITHIVERIIRNVAQVIERDPGVQEITVAHLLSAMKENEHIYECFKGMRTRSSMEKRALGRSASRKASRSESMSHLSTERLKSSRSTSETARSGAAFSLSSHEPIPARSVNNVQASRHHNDDQMFYNSDDDPTGDSLDFEAQLTSGQTLKLSLSPDRLQAKSILAGKTDIVKDMPAASPMRMNSKLSNSKLTARAAKIDEETDEEDDIGYGKKPKKEPLAELFASEPPWAREEERSVLKSSTPARMISSTSAPSLNGLSKHTTNGSFDHVSPFQQPKKALPRLLPKDEREAPVGSQDLINFLARSAPSEDFSKPRALPTDTEPTRKKSSNKLRNFMKLGSTPPESANMYPPTRDLASEPMTPRRLPLSSRSSHSNHGPEGPSAPSPSYNSATTPPRAALITATPVVPVVPVRFQPPIAKPSTVDPFSTPKALPPQAVRQSSLKSVDVDVSVLRSASSQLPTTDRTPIRTSPPMPAAIPYAADAKSVITQTVQIKHGLPTPANSIDDIAALVASTPKTDRMPASSVRPPLTPPISPERTSSFRLKRVPTPRITAEEATSYIQDPIKEIKEDPSQPAESTLPRKTYPLDHNRVKTSPTPSERQHARSSSAVSTSENGILAMSRSSSNSSHTTQESNTAPAIPPRRKKLTLASQSSALRADAATSPIFSDGDSQDQADSMRTDRDLLRYLNAQFRNMRTAQECIELVEHLAGLDALDRLSAPGMGILQTKEHGEARVARELVELYLGEQMPSEAAIFEMPRRNASTRESFKSLPNETVPIELQADETGVLGQLAT